MRPPGAAGFQGQRGTVSRNGGFVVSQLLLDETQPVVPSCCAGLLRCGFLKQGRRFLILPKVEVGMPQPEGKISIGTDSAVEQCCVGLDGGCPVSPLLKKKAVLDCLVFGANADYYCVLMLLLEMWQGWLAPGNGCFVGAPSAV
jgi:hypothetical protein